MRLWKFPAEQVVLMMTGDWSCPYLHHSCEHCLIQQFLEPILLCDVDSKKNCHSSKALYWTMIAKTTLLLPVQEEVYLK